jgi:diadenosine tetraphosphate (Ap4A) HIT family hydrolase
LSDCPYCNVSAEDAWIANDDVVAVPHPSPVAACHVVVAPRRHVPAFYDLDVQEQHAIWNVMAALRERISAMVNVQRFQAGFVDAAAGSEPAHTHVHLVPLIAGQRLELPAGAEWVELS